MEVDLDYPLPVMRCCGVIDTEGVNVPLESKLMQALYGIHTRHSANELSMLPIDIPSYPYIWNAGVDNTSDFLEVAQGHSGLSNEYDDDHLPRGFPTLFPFGKGSMGLREKVQPVSWEKQIRSQLLQSHGAFNRHEIYMFIVLDIMQRRKICLGAKLMTRKSNLSEVIALLKDFDYKTVYDQLRGDINRGRRHVISDPTLSKLMQVTSMANGFVKGSQEDINMMRNEIKGENIHKGTAKFFITLNPDEARHMLVMGLMINDEEEAIQCPLADDFNEYLQVRHKIMAQDPVKQVLFFDIIIRTVLDIIFGFGSPEKIGILGEVASHYFVIETQGKGTLHTHGLVWLTDGIG
jgi:hypothetical protein